MPELENNERVNLDTGSIEVPKAMESFLTNIPTKGNVEVKEEEPKKEVTKTAEELAAELEDPKKEDPKKEEETPEEENSENPPKEEKKPEEDDDEDSVIHLMASSFKDIELEGEFEDSEEGLINVTKFIVAKKEEAAEIRGVENFLAKKPILKDISDHLDAGGSLISLIQSKQVEDFASIKLVEDDVTGLEKMYKQALLVKGVEEDEVEGLINAAKDSGQLFTRATKSQEFLTAKQKEVVDAQVAAEKKEFEAEKVRQASVIKQIGEVITSGKINSIAITPDQGKRLNDFTTKQDSQGRTERDKKYDSLTLEQWMALDLIVMENFSPLTGIKEKDIPTSKKVKFVVKKAKPTIDLNTGGAGKVSKALDSLGIDNARDLFK